MATGESDLVSTAKRREESTAGGQVRGSDREWQASRWVARGWEATPKRLLRPRPASRPWRGRGEALTLPRDPGEAVQSSSCCVEAVGGDPGGLESSWKALRGDGGLGWRSSEEARSARLRDHIRSRLRLAEGSHVTERAGKEKDGSRLAWQVGV